MNEVTKRPRPKFYYQTVPTDTWQKIICHAKYIELFLGGGEEEKYRPGDVIIFQDASNPYPRAVCAIEYVKKYSGFKEAWPNVSKHGLGYIGAEADDAQYTDYEYEYPMRQIIENGVVYVTWNLISAEYCKQTVRKSIQPKAAEEKPTAQQSQDIVEQTAETAEGQMVEEQSAVESVAETDAEEPTSEEVTEEAAIDEESEESADIPEDTVEVTKPAAIDSQEETHTAMQTAFLTAMSKAEQSVAV